MAVNTALKIEELIGLIRERLIVLVNVSREKALSPQVPHLVKMI